MPDSNSSISDSSISEAPHPDRSSGKGLSWIVLGPDGLRAGWRCLLFTSIVVVSYFVMSWVLRPLFVHLLHGSTHMDTMPIGLALLVECAQAPGAFLATIVMALIEGRSFFSYGYQGRARALRFFCGLGWGFVAICFFILVLWKLHFWSLDGQVLHGGAILKYAVSWGVMFLLVAFFEETALRGYLQYTLTRGIGFWWGAILLALLFGFSHGTNNGESYVGLFSAGAVGLIFCLSLWYTGSLWFAVGFHAAWDWGQSFFFGTADSGVVSEGHLFAAHPVGNVLWSGGVTGPEGSLLVMGMLGLFALCMWAWWGRQGSALGIPAWKPAEMLPSRIRPD